MPRELSSIPIGKFCLVDGKLSLVIQVNAAGAVNYACRLCNGRIETTHWAIGSKSVTYLPMVRNWKWPTGLQSA